MGGNWSQDGSGVADKPKDDSKAETNPSKDVEEEETTRNRKRRRGTDDSSTEEEEKPRRRKRRRVSKAWNLFADFITSLVAKGFLMAADWATKHAKQGELADNDVIDAVVHILDYFQGSHSDILRRGWRVLCACNSTPSSPTLPIDLSADIPTVISAMKVHKNSIKIQLLGCRALRTLVTSNNSEEKWDGLCRAGAVPVFLQSLRNFPNDLVMQGLAITFVAMAVREEGEVPRRLAVNAGAIQLVLDAMRRFEDDPRLLHTGCFALHQLGFIRQSRNIILSNGGVEVFLAVVRQHINDASLVDICLSALSKLTDGNGENLVGHGVVPLILDISEKFPEEQSIQGHNLVLLLRLVGQEPFPKRRCILLVLSAMRKFSSSASLQFFACATLREILQRTRGREALDITCAEGGIECVLTAVKNHRGVFGIQPMALLFLLHVFEQWQQPEHVEAVGAFGGSEEIVAMVTALRVELDPELQVPVVEIR